MSFRQSVYGLLYKKNYFYKLLHEEETYEPNIAITTSSFNISIDPLAIKYNEVRTSPLCTSVSPKMDILE